MSAEQGSASSEDLLRKEARKRIKSRRDFKQVAAIFVIVWCILIGIWFLSGGGYFWPAWAIFGMGIALAFIALDAYGPRKQITEEQIQDEMRKLQGG